jgi:WD40 repeat protein
VWPLGTTAAVARPLGRTAAADSISASADGRRLAFTRDDGAVAVVDVATGAELYRLRLPRSMVVTRTQLSQDGVQLVTQSGSSLKLWSLPGKSASAAATRDVVPTALALDRTSDLVAVGLASGQLQVSPVAAASASSPLAYFGHRGRITAAALNAGRGLAATGGADGIVRIWDAGSGAPTGIVAQQPDSAITLVALSGDGQYVAAVSERVVRVAAVADGRVTAELQAEAPVAAIAFAPDAASVAAGDALGTVLIARFVAPSRSANVRLAAAVTSLAFAADGSRIAVGDASGSITLVDAESGETRSTVRRWSSPIRWLDFSDDGGVLLVATDDWLHAVAATTPALEPLQSKLAAWPASDMAATVVSATAIGFAGVATDGSLVSGVLDLAASDGDVRDGAALVARDWQTAFALRLNDNGEPVPLER